MTKDWTGSKNSIYTTMGASNHTDKEREQNDYYATDPTAIDDLFAVEKFSDRIWEPACGEGHLSKRMEHFGKGVYSTDLIDRGFGHGNVNFFDVVRPLLCTDIITNPPYKYAQEFIEKALELTGNKVAMFLKLTFLEGKKRKFFFAKYPPKTVYVYSYRKNCAQNGDFMKFPQDKAICFAWFVWEKGFKGDTIIKWI